MNDQMKERMEDARSKKVVCVQLFAEYKQQGAGLPLSGHVQEVLIHCTNTTWASCRCSARNATWESSAGGRRRTCMTMWVSGHLPQSSETGGGLYKHMNRSAMKRLPY